MTTDATRGGLSDGRRRMVLADLRDLRSDGPSWNGAVVRQSLGAVWASWWMGNIIPPCGAFGASCIWEPCQVGVCYEDLRNPLTRALVKWLY